MNSNSTRQIHVSPGIYYNEVDLSYASKSLGITTLGLVGETVKGPAFQPITVDSWRTFQNYFGGTNTEKFIGSQYPKYELPYIAKTYLSESQNLKVCRVLGLSGVNAGPAWVISAYKDEEGAKYAKNENPVLLAVLRSRGEHRKVDLVKENGECGPEYAYDKIRYYAKSVKALKTDKIESASECKSTQWGKSKETHEFSISPVNRGTFTLEVTSWDDVTTKYDVSLNPADKDYILNVLGTDPAVGDAEIFVEELYDVLLSKLIERGEVDALYIDEGEELPKFNQINIVPNIKPVDDLLTMDESMLTRRMVGNRYLYSAELSVNTDAPVAAGDAYPGIKVYNPETSSSVDGEVGVIYVVTPFTNADGTREYHYVKADQLKNISEGFDKNDADYWDDSNNVFKSAVECLADGRVYVYSKYNVDDDEADVYPVTFDINNYKSEYRYATTPWVVSEIKGSATNIDLTRLFRFHTISDGNGATTEVKVSIANIRPDEGTFDVLVRSFYDTDASPVILEKYTQCNLIPGSEKYIAHQIGSFDEGYETKSNYITVEVNESDKTRLSVPAGFMGYPTRDYTGSVMVDDMEGKLSLAHNVVKPEMVYNLNVDEDTRVQKQYFGISEVNGGIDTDMLKFKGVASYDETPAGLTHGFHLDSRISPDIENQSITVDGEVGYGFDTVGAGNKADFGMPPMFGTEADMAGTIYEDVRYRKFTVAFYGGWDGWDYYRAQRSNTDEFLHKKYRGHIDPTSGEGTSISVIKNNELYGLENDTKANTSDYYAYLSAIRMFANPKNIDINVLATPGIDYVNNASLVQEVIDMVETERADSVYVVTTPDKPAGAGDSVLEMFTPEEAVDNLEESDIDSNYTCTFYPWVKYYDQDNSQYIYLPATKDCVRNFAYTDNTVYPWFAAAGWNRGNVEAVKVKKTLKLGEQDELYANRINFINSFPDEGLKLWGDKNLQVAETQMNRISKRRLMVRLRKLISIACVGFLFDPNDNSMGQAIRSAITPILQDVVDKRGLIDFRMEIDDSQEMRDKLAIGVNIYVKLQPNLEYINITFTITPNGVTFTDI